MLVHYCANNCNIATNCMSVQTLEVYNILSILMNKYKIIDSYITNFEL